MAILPKRMVTKGIFMIEAIFALTLATVALYLLSPKKQKAPVPVKVEKAPRKRS